MHLRTTGNCPTHWAKRYAYHLATQPTRKIPSHLLEAITELNERGVGFRSLQGNLDTTSSTGKLVFHIFGALAEFEHDLIRDRTNAGLQAARARGRVGGRPRKLDKQKLRYTRYLMKDPKRTMTSIAEELEVGRSTLYRALKEEVDHEQEIQQGPAS